MFDTSTWRSLSQLSDAQLEIRQIVLDLDFVLKSLWEIRHEPHQVVESGPCRGWAGQITPGVETSGIKFIFVSMPIKMLSYTASSHS